MAVTAMNGCASPRKHTIGQAARALHASLSFHLASPAVYEWVPGHAGQEANELADALAQFGMHCIWPAVPFKLSLDEWFGEHASAFQWAPHAFWAEKYPRAAPGREPGQLCWDSIPPPLTGSAVSVIAPFLPDEVLQPNPQTREGWTFCQVTVATYNALSIADTPRPTGQQAGLHAETGRVNLLATSLREQGVVIAGLQETRTEPGQSTCGPYARFASGADGHHNFGCEVWIDVQSRFGTGKMSFQFSVAHVVVQHAEPTMLVLRIKNHAVDWQIGCLHGPHRARPETERLQWWQRATTICQSVDTGGLWLLLLDGNCRLGSETSRAVDGHQADQQDSAGQLVHELILQLRTFVPFTFEHMMVGPPGTLVQKRSGQWDRSDFVCLPQKWQALDVQVRVEPGVSAGHRCVDHLCVIATTQLLIQSRGAPRKRQWGISAAAIRDPHNKEVVEDILRRAPAVDWQVSVHEHVAELKVFLQKELHACFPEEKRPMRASYFSAHTAELHKMLCASRKMLKSRTAALGLARVRCAFLVWRDGRNVESAFLDLFQGRWLQQLVCHIALDAHRVSIVGLQLKRSCRTDKAAFAAKLADELQEAPEHCIHAAFKELVRPRKFVAAQGRPLPRLRNEDGTFCQSPADIQARWRRHFASFEAGVVTEPESLVVRCAANQQDKRCIPLSDCSGLPSYLHLESTLRCTPPRKASGPDRIPPDVGRLFSSNVAELLWPILLKTMLRATEAAGYKGSTLHRIPKPHGDRASCAASRAITVQCGFGKAIQKSLRFLAANEFEKRSHPLLFGGRRGQSALFGAFVSRTFMRQAKASKQSAAIAFFDLAAAFYGIVRQLLTGEDRAEASVTEIAAGLNLSPGNLQELAGIIADDPVISQCSTPSLHQMTAEIGQSTWYVMKGDDAFVESKRGTRPGGPWADVLFHLLFTRIAARHDEPPAGCGVPYVDWDHCRAPVAPPAPDAVKARLKVRDITYADDLAVCATSTTAARIAASTSYAASSVLDAFGSYGLIPNFGPTKTAVLIAPSGQASRQARNVLYNVQKGVVNTLLEHSGGVQLQAVSSYKHLGCMVTHVGHLLTEIKRRICCANTSFQEGRRLVYCSPRIDIQRRVRLFQSRVLSVLFHGAGTWHWLTPGEYKEISTTYFSYCRKLLRIPHHADQKWTRSQVYTWGCLIVTRACVLRDCVSQLSFPPELQIRSGPSLARTLNIFGLLETHVTGFMACCSLQCLCRHPMLILHLGNSCSGRGLGNGKAG